MLPPFIHFSVTIHAYRWGLLSESSVARHSCVRDASAWCAMLTRDWDGRLPLPINWAKKLLPFDTR